jgi:hypothetical protein
METAIELPPHWDQVLRRGDATRNWHDATPNLGLSIRVRLLR